MSKRFRVMAPLLVNYTPEEIKGVNLDKFILLTGLQQTVTYSEFRSLLVLARGSNFKAIVVDVWWGIVQREIDGELIWHYYDRLFDDIRAASLKIVPGLAFHQCGGNVGDGNISIPLPSGALIALDSNGHRQDLRCKSEYSKGTGGNCWVTANFGASPAINPDGCEESLSPWSTFIPEVQKRYYNFMLAFVMRYRRFMVGENPSIKDIYIGLGPCGELRYPSYNTHDEISPNHPKRVGYPTRGAFQGYSDLAIVHFRDYLRSKYIDDTALKRMWGSSVNIDDAFPPRNTEEFFKNQDYKKIQYGKDLYDWYSKSLLQHAEIMFELARLARADAGLDGLLDLHMKIPGVHWLQRGERIAEMNAGIIPSDGAFNASDDFGYQQILRAIKNSIKPDGVSFTCLELDDREKLENDGSFSSIAKELVYNFIHGCEKYQIKVDGENALGSELLNNRAWENMENVMRYSSVRVITLLRLQDLDKYIFNHDINVSQKAREVGKYLRSLHSRFNLGEDISPEAKSVFFQNRATPESVLKTIALTAMPEKIKRSSDLFPPLVPRDFYVKKITPK